MLAYLYWFALGWLIGSSDWSGIFSEAPEDE